MQCDWRSLLVVIFIARKWLRTIIIACSALCRVFITRYYCGNINVMILLRVLCNNILTIILL